MRLRLILACAAVACLGFGAPAFAQTAQQDLEQYMKSHPELQQNPNLMNNPVYLDHHPDLARWLAHHPHFDRGRYGMGAWDREHRWRDADWWHRNDPDWVYDHHPEWIQSHPIWMDDGDYDDTHHWRDRDWWEQNHPDWVNEHHPRWERAEDHYEQHHGNGNAYGNPHNEPPGHGKGNGHGNGRKD